MPYIEKVILQFAMRDNCIKEIIKYEASREMSNAFGKKHPKKNLNEARDLMTCFANK
jgi:hypothetical protein